MELFFLICAAFGGTLIVCQVLMGLLGIGGDHGDSDGGSEVDHDTGADHGSADGNEAEDGGGSSSFFGLLSFRALAAALTFFGLSGLAAFYANLGTVLALAIGVISGGAALFAVASMMRFLAKLKSDGTVRLERALGQSGTVYLKIPAKKSGPGKVTLVLQNRTVEMLAVTPNEELPTGAKIKVTALIDAQTVEVVAASALTPTFTQT